MTEPPASPGPPGPPASGERFTMALIEEATRKSGLVWLTVGDERARAVWHLWHDGAAYVVTGGPEQPLPALRGSGEAGEVGEEAASAITVTVPSKDTRGRLVSWRARVTIVDPDSEHWHTVAGELAAKRLNAPEPAEELVERWARQGRIIRLEPTGEIAEGPGAMPAASQAAPPPPSPA
ncbi:MAG: hypothetical protein ACRDPK_20665, partial [Carbonactinosporaceae bacterium]